MMNAEPPATPSPPRVTRYRLLSRVGVPVLSPDGRTLVVEGVDSVTGKTDLYALRLP